MKVNQRSTICRAIGAAMLPCLLAGVLSAASAAPRVPDANSLMDWAEIAFPQHFPGHETSGNAPPYLYRYYARSGNYLGVAGSDVYVFGPVSAGQLLRVGSVSDFTCSVYPADCLADVGTNGSFQLAGVTTSAAGVVKAVAFDPGQPQTAAALAAQPTGLDLNEMSVSSPIFKDPLSSPAYRRDAATGQRTYLGTALKFFTSNGRLYQVDLRRGQTAKAVQVSSASKLCFIESVTPIDDSGADAWVYAVEEGPDKSCVRRRQMIRSGTPASQAAPPAFDMLLLSDGTVPAFATSARAPLRDRDGRALWFAGMERKGNDIKMRLYSARDLSAGPMVTIHADLDGIDSRFPMEGYRLGTKDILRVSWTAAGVISTSSIPYKRKSSAWGQILVSSDSIYIPDGPDIVRVTRSGTASVVATMPFDPRATDPTQRLASISLSETPTRIIAAVKNGFLQTLAIGSIPKAGEATTMLTTAAQEGGYLSYLGASGENVMYGVDLRGLTKQPLPQLKLDRLMRIGSDGSGRAQVEPSVFLAGTVWAAQSVGLGVRDHVVPEIVGVLACRHGRSEPTCSDSQFIEYRPHTAQTTVLGSFPVLVGGELVKAHAVEGLPARVGYNAWVTGGTSLAFENMFRPGVAQSLVQVLAP